MRLEWPEGVPVILAILALTLAWNEFNEATVWLHGKSDAVQNLFPLTRLAPLCALPLIPLGAFSVRAGRDGMATFLLALGIVYLERTSLRGACVWGGTFEFWRDDPAFWFRPMRNAALFGLLLGAAWAWKRPWRISGRWRLGWMSLGVMAAGYILTAALLFLAPPVFLDRSIPVLRPYVGIFLILVFAATLSTAQREAHA